MMISRRGFLGGVVVLTVGVGGLASLRSAQSQTASSDGTLTPHEALAAIAAGDIILIDIRRPDEWRATGIADGAVPIDMRREDFVEAVRAARPDPSVAIALICARGVRSRRTFNALQDAGIPNIIDVPEGMLGSRAGPGWIASDLPMVDWVDPA